MNMSVAKHVSGIDAMRFTAAVMVMLYHYGFWLSANPTGDGAEASQRLVSFPALYSSSQFGWIGVQIFFVISGFVIAYSAEKATAFSFFVTRLIRLLPAVLICATITLLASYALGYQNNGWLASAYIRSILFFPQPPYVDPSYWTLAIELAFYGLVFLLLTINRFRWIRALAIVLGLISGIYLSCVVLASIYPDNAVFQNLQSLYGKRLAEISLLKHGCFFSLGVFLWLQFVKQPSKQNMLGVLLLTAIGCLQIYTLYLSRYKIVPSPNIPMFIWLTAMGIMILSIIYNRRMHDTPPWITQTLRRLGLMTYPLYLIHQIAGLVLMGALVKIGVQPYVALVTTIVTVLAMSWLISARLEPSLAGIFKKWLYGLKDYHALRFRRPTV